MALVGYGCYWGTFLWGAYPKDSKIVILYDARSQNIRCFWSITTLIAMGLWDGLDDRLTCQKITFS